MRKIEEIGICPNCNCSICTFKTNNYKRFAKCEICGLSYALPKRGTINNSALTCPTRELPILIVEKKDQKAYFWVDGPCFSCVDVDKCQPVKELIKEFTDLKVYGY
ncbi:hypothetical protein ES703_60817 [subsurface metagenome]